MRLIFAGLDDDALRKMLADIRQEIVDGASKDVFLVDVFALVREAAKRTLGQRHFDVQIDGGNCSSPWSNCGDENR